MAREQTVVSWAALGKGTAIGVIFLGLAAGGLVGCPNYTVWQQGKAGEAQLRKAEQNRQIKIQEAEAIKASATLLAEAEVERAKGVREANQIIAEGLGGPEGYLRYLWINQLSENGQNVIYIPTETGMPILEAGKRDTARSSPAIE
ncbi:MAG: hypothetical protein NXH70_02210 [Hyphomonas sp.]|nr:hypothetical protein [Hyphomonas sp.]